ncbi:MAG: hypothetical protein IPM39_12970 [Chloroflexi bacterium]|nr:hypothetical protein [Chloroflexota bacterium]
MSSVHCFDNDGLIHLAAADSLAFASAVYGIFVENDRLLLLSQKSTQLYAPPGCILTFHQVPTQAIRHYFRRLAAITPNLGPLLLLEDQYRWLDGRAWRIAAMYYAVSRPFTAAIYLNETLEPDATPTWIDPDALQRDQFLFGYKAVTAGISRLNPARR